MTSGSGRTSYGQTNGFPISCLPTFRPAYYFSQDERGCCVAGARADIRTATFTPEPSVPHSQHPQSTMARLNYPEHRTQQVGDHLRPSSKNHVVSKNPDDVVIVAAYRSALTKGKKGSFKDVGTDYLLVKFIEAFLSKEGIDPTIIEDIACANVLKARSGITEHRVATIKAGIPDTVPIFAINRQCASGLMAIGDIANKIKTGEIDCGLALGVESMSKDHGPDKSRPEITSIYDKDATMQKRVIDTYKTSLLLNLS